ncbi:hypothetical protein DVH24_003399 [Malus domestica]|uniref:Uncharacterized protein n=1 Tax=Malus domestica TaxID=3750 RepID=A0A498IN43_MALDO|nr:hypothetical protein DVH24_003399 [Malus domestica]
MKSHRASLISVNSDHDQYRIVGLPERGLGVESDSREGYGSRETRVGARFTFDLGNRCTDREMWRNIGVGLRGTRVQRNGVGGMCWWVRNSGPRVSEMGFSTLPSAICSTVAIRFDWEGTRIDDKRKYKGMHLVPTFEVPSTNRHPKTGLRMSMMLCGFGWGKGSHVNAEVRMSFSHNMNDEYEHCPFSTLIASQILPLLNTTSSTKDVNHGELCKAPLQFICLNLQQNGKLLPKQKVKVIRGTNLAVRDMMTSDPNVILTLGKQPPGYFLLFELLVKVNIQNIPRRDIRERKTGFRNGFCLNLGFAFTAMYAGLYVCLDKKAGSVAVLLCVLCWVQSPCLLAVLLTLQAQRIIKLWKSCRLRWTNYLRPDLKRGFIMRYAVGQFLNIPKAYLCFSNDDINDEFCDATFGPLIHDLIARECPFLEIACILIAGLTFILWLIVFSIHDLIAREGPFLEIACILIAGLTIILWLIVVVSSIVLAVFMNILI